MTQQICCVDHTRPGTHLIAGRWFCEEHYARATYRRPGVWRSELLAVAGLLVFVGLVAVLDSQLQPRLASATLLAAGLLLALVPAGLWLAFFYQQDRLEPEPLAHVARLFVIGLALAGAIGLPLTHQVFRIESWLFQDPQTTMLGSVFVIGTIQAFTVFAAVRYFIFDAPEFDERTDGVVYGTAAALGYATAVNVQFILTSGGAALGSAEIYVAEVALAQAAFGGLLGYFLGRARLEQEPIWWLPAGLGLTAVLNGLFNVARLQADPGTVVVGAEAGLPSFTGLLLAGGLAAGVALVVYWLINRDIRRSLAGGQPAATQDPAAGDRRASLAALLTAAALLAAGGLTWYNAAGRTTAFKAGGLSGAYPAHFDVVTGEADVLRVADFAGGGAEFAVGLRPPEADLESMAVVLAGERSADFDAYRVLESGLTEVAGQQALMQRFAYVDAGGLAGGMPEVLTGLDYILAAGDQTAVITLLTTPEDLPVVEPVFARFINSLRLGGGG